MPTTVNIHHAKTHLSALIAQVAAGEEIIIAKNGTPVARLLPTAQATPRTPGRFLGQIIISESFHEPMTEEELSEMENGHPGDPLRTIPR